MCSNPKPERSALFFKGERSVVRADSCRPGRPYPLRIQGRVAWILLQQFKILDFRFRLCCNDETQPFFHFFSVGETSWSRCPCTIGTGRSLLPVPLSGPGGLAYRGICLFPVKTESSRNGSIFPFRSFGLKPARNYRGKLDMTLSP